MRINNSNYISFQNHRKSPLRSSFVTASLLMVFEVHCLDFRQNFPKDLKMLLQFKSKGLLMIIMIWYVYITLFDHHP